jgi:nitrogen fixation-related uncharacterized protein
MWTVIKSILFRLVELGLFLWRNKQQQIKDLAQDVRSLGQAKEDEKKLKEAQQKLEKHKKTSVEDIRNREKQLIEDSNHVDRSDLVDIINSD